MHTPHLSYSALSKIACSESEDKYSPFLSIIWWNHNSSSTRDENKKESFPASHFLAEFANFISVVAQLVTRHYFRKELLRFS